MGNQSLIRELTCTARPFFTSEAEKLGLVSKVVEGSRDEVVKSALELAKFIATTDCCVKFKTFVNVFSRS